MNMFNIFKASNKKLLKIVARELKRHGYQVKKNVKFVYGEGTIPILLVAHVDTVHVTLPHDIYVDKDEQVMWSPQGLGADDRAGVYAILQILEKGYRPFVLFTDEEESGGIGATNAAYLLKPDVKYVIGLDRRGSNDAVYYDCANCEFEDYITSQGFNFACGSFSDISILCPEWGIAGVNLSVGYYCAHTKAEYLKLNELNNTIQRVSKMLDNPPDSKYEYIELYYNDYLKYLEGITFDWDRISHGRGNKKYYLKNWGGI